MRFEEADGFVDFVNGHEMRGGFEELLLHAQLLHISLHRPDPHLITSWNQQKRND